MKATGDRIVPSSHRVVMVHLVILLSLIGLSLVSTHQEMRAPRNDISGPCNCIFELYDPTLCNPDAMCSNTGAMVENRASNSFNIQEFTCAVRGSHCMGTLNCPAGSTVSLRYKSGISVRDITITQFLQNYRIECVQGQWMVVYEAAQTGEQITGIVCNVVL